MSALEGVVEPVEAPQIGPGNAPGPLEPTVIDDAWYPCMCIHWEDGPEYDEVEVIAREYVGYYDDGDLNYDYHHYSPLPGKWVGGLVCRYDIAYIFYDRSTTENLVRARREWREIWDEALARDPDYAVSLNVATGYLELTKEAVVKLIKSGQLAAAKTGRGKSWRIKAASLKAYREGRP